jgi:hypothetical protein
MRMTVAFGLECKRKWAVEILKGKGCLSSCFFMLPHAQAYVQRLLWLPQRNKLCRPEPLPPANQRQPILSQPMPDPPYGPPLPGAKSIEVRRYPLPPQLLNGQKCWLIAAEGRDGVATFGADIEAGDARGRLLGWVIFGDIVTYTTAEQFAADEGSHHVPENSIYGFSASGGQPLFGWRVAASHQCPQSLALPQMRRLLRSIYQVCD